MDSVFLLNDAGSFLLEKHYRGRCSRAVCEPLLQQLQQHGPRVSVESSRLLVGDDSHALLYIYREGLLLAAVCSTEAEPLLVLEELQQLYSLMSRQWGDSSGVLTEAGVRCNYSGLLVLLDFAIEGGYPFILEPNLVEAFIKPSSVVDKALHLVQGSSRVLTSLAASIGLGGQQQQQQQQQPLSSEMVPGSCLGTGSGKGEGSGLSGSGSDYWWRRGSVYYASNEVYVDLVEHISGIVSSNGQMLNSSITGKILMNSRLSGVPELTLTLRQPQLLQFAGFHPSVRLSRFMRDGVLSFCPPDKEFCLASYWLHDKSFSLPVSVSGRISFPRSSSSSSSSRLDVSGSAAAAGGQSAAAAPAAAAAATSGRLSLKLTAHNPLGAGPIKSSSISSSSGNVEKIVVEVSVPSFVGGATLTASAGSIRLLPSKNMIVWEVPSLAFDAPAQTAEGTVSLVADEAQRRDVVAPCEARLVAKVNFLVKNWAASGLKFESLDVSGVAAQPYKGCRCGTVAGDLEFRLNN